MEDLTDYIISIIIKDLLMIDSTLVQHEKERKKYDGKDISVWKT